MKEIYNEALLKKTNLTKRESNSALKNFFIT